MTNNSIRNNSMTNNSIKNNSLNKSQNKSKILVIGAGPAGLACSYSLAISNEENIHLDLVESGTEVGGLAKTVDFGGYLYDMGSHRFFSKLPVVNKLWQDILGDDFIKVKRITRIYYCFKFYFYPLKIQNAFWNLGLFRSVKIIASFINAKLSPLSNENNFENWVINRFGYELFNTFFKAYTEKVWGIPCNQIGAKWAAQRIKNLSLISAVLNALSLGKKNNVKSLIDEFKYPKYGAGYMYTKLAERIVNIRRDFKITCSSKVVGLRYNDNKWIARIKTDKSIQTLEYDYVVSSMPLTSLILGLDNVPKEITIAASKLHYRDMILVCFVIDQKNTLKDTWIYIHDPKLQIGRLQILNNWGKYMIKNNNFSSFTAEYFCSEGDKIWSLTDGQLIIKTVDDLKNCRLIPNKSNLVQGHVIRLTKTYPVYDKNYEIYMGNIIAFMKTLPKLQVIGRYGMFKYNNMDHSIYTGMLAAENILNGYIKYDLWNVNQDEEYHEEVKRKV